MSPEVIAALIGAAVGAVLTGGMGYLQQRWSHRAQDRAEQRRQKLNLVREIMRYRMDQPKLLYPLNEIPILFGDDEEVMRLYRELMTAPDLESRNKALTDIMNRLAKLINLPPRVKVSDLERGFLPIS